jgi:hypothetical protein
MEYQKPEVVVLGLALGVVRGTKKEPVRIVDSENLQLTEGAYEADE